ncbi:hypothetical protein KY333_02875 [Candidatus Woesearchaeota archaeon]|nr:hypothetical protein [Candidatus Woesearchaeota archaeon]MBW2994384.1 hypothetical protein [Candidatus Woesearchaeota archaeon]
MAEITFNREYVPARKDLLHFVEENLNKDILAEVGKNPEKWIEELNIINQILTRDSLVGGSGMEQVPLGWHGLQKLGENVFLYRGTENRRARGLWIYDPKARHNAWDHYRLGTTGQLRINQEFAGISSEELLPDNFEKKSRVVKQDKRPIHEFDVMHDSKRLTIYAKGSLTDISFMYQPPSHRLTNLSRVSKMTSREEMDISVKLAEQGVKTPPVVGYYTSDVEEFLFLQGIEGKTPPEFFGTHRKEIIEQDAKMLATLCLLGYRKSGFADFDDKIFDGTDLYLIDTEDVRDLYFPSRPDFRQMVLNPRETKTLEAFRGLQEDRFLKSLQDALYEYQESLTPTLADKVLYARTFFRTIGWEKSTIPEIKDLATFPGVYQTWDSYLSMMCDAD